MSKKPPTWESYTAMQFKLEREIAEIKGDRNKYKYAWSKYQDQSARIAWLENKVTELERQVNET